MTLLGVVSPFLLFETGVSLRLCPLLGDAEITDEVKGGGVDGGVDRGRGGAFIDTKVAEDTCEAQGPVETSDEGEACDNEVVGASVDVEAHVDRG